MVQIKYNRVLIKLSGEALSGKDGHGIDFQTVQNVCEKIGECLRLGAEVAVVIGAGNFWRGRQGTDMDHVKADQMGMLATIINCIALQDTFERTGIPCALLTATEMSAFGQRYTADKAKKCLSEGKVVLCAGGTGNPYFTTDTAAALRAVEIGADIALFAKNIDGVYTADPRVDKTAVRLDHIGYTELLSKGLAVIDAAAAALCRDNDMPVFIFDLGDGSNITRVIKGENIGTILNNED